MIEKMYNYANDFSYTFLNYSKNQYSALSQKIAAVFLSMVDCFVWMNDALVTIYARSNPIHKTDDFDEKITSFFRNIAETHHTTSLSDQEIHHPINFQPLRLCRNDLSTFHGGARNLTNLQILDLSRNSLSTLPSELGKLVALKQVNLSQNNLSALPDEFKKLKNLTSLYINRNSFTSLPPEIFHLTNLQDLYLGYNQLSTLPPSLAQLTNLRSLSLHHNKLIQLSSEFKNLTSLFSLDISANNFTFLPPEIFHLKNLLDLYLTDLKLTQLPSEFKNLTSLVHLDISANNFTSLPLEIFHLTNLQNLYLGENQLSTLPPNLGQLTNLQSLCLDHNKLTHLPSEFKNLTRLTALSIDENNFTSLPLEIFHLTSLEFLHLESTQLSMLPPELAQLTNLRYLYLSGNELVELLQNIGNLQKLISLSVGLNPELKELPLSLGNISTLSTIHIEGTKISETLRDAILTSCRRLRKVGLINQFEVLLKKWFEMNALFFDEKQTINFTDEEKITVSAWLLRLEKAADFKNNQQKLCKIVCNIFQTVLEDKDFRSIFISQVQANNEACGDRAAMSLNEIFTAWQIHISPSMPLDDQLILLQKAAKSNALRRIVAQKVAGYLEGVEVFLYCETQLKDKLGLLSVIHTMLHEDIGKNKLNLAVLEEEVNNSYLLYLVEIPAFKAILEKDVDFQLAWNHLEKEFAEKLNEVDEAEYAKDNDKKIALDNVVKQKNSRKNEIIDEWLSNKQRAFDRKS